LAILYYRNFYVDLIPTINGKDVRNNITHYDDVILGTTHGVKAYKIKTPYQEDNSSAEYLFLENRKTGVHNYADTDLPGSGLAIYRVNQNVRGNI